MSRCYIQCLMRIFVTVYGFVFVPIIATNNGIIIVRVVTSTITSMTIGNDLTNTKKNKINRDQQALIIYGKISNAFTVTGCQLIRYLSHVMSVNNNADDIIICHRSPPYHHTIQLTLFVLLFAVCAIYTDC